MISERVATIAELIAMSIIGEGESCSGHDWDTNTLMESDVAEAMSYGLNVLELGQLEYAVNQYVKECLVK